MSWFDVTPVPPVPISRGRPVIFDIVEYILMEWTMPNESRICTICRRMLNVKKEEECRLSVCHSQVQVRNVWWTQKLDRQVLGIFFFRQMRFEIIRLRLQFLACWDLPMWTSLFVGTTELCEYRHDLLCDIQMRYSTLPTRSESLHRLLHMGRLFICLIFTFYLPDIYVCSWLSSWYLWITLHTLYYSKMFLHRLFFMGESDHLDDNLWYRSLSQTKRKIYVFPSSFFDERIAPWNYLYTYKDLFFP